MQKTALSLFVLAFSTSLFAQKEDNSGMLKDSGFTDKLKTIFAQLKKIPETTTRSTGGLPAGLSAATHLSWPREAQRKTIPKTTLRATVTPAGATPKTIKPWHDKSPVPHR
jgi:hypothetical protein